MYCFTYANGLNCILNELLLWTDISSEHPIFIRTVASLTKKNLSQDILKELMDVQNNFAELNKKVRTVRSNIQRNPYNFPVHSMELRKLIKSFLIHDKHFLSILPEVKQYGKEDKVWQTLLNHITHEQRFMYELMTDLNNQLL